MRMAGLSTEAPYNKYYFNYIDDNNAKHLNSYFTMNMDRSNVTQ